MRLEVPRGGKPLCVGMQGDMCMVWIEVDPVEPKVSMELFSVGTGFGAVPTDTKYLGTIFQGPYVWHIYILEEIC